MEFFQAIILGIIQGATEFLPVSSSGHLVLIREFLGWEDGGLSFDIVLHLATLVAVLVYFRSAWGRMLAGLGRSQDQGKRLLGGVVVATIPAAILGYLGEQFLSTYFRSALTVGTGMIIVGFLCLWAERAHSRRQTVKSKQVLSWWGYLYIGLAQAIALLPGVSRSGMTIVAGMDRALSRREAAEFSFLLSVPIILGAGIFDLVKYADALEINFAQIVLGFVAALGVGYASIYGLMHFLVRHRLNIFAYYLFFVGLAAIVFSIFQ